MRIYSRIIGTGSHLPAKIMTNADLEKIVDTDGFKIELGLNKGMSL